MTLVIYREIVTETNVLMDQRLRSYSDTRVPVIIVIHDYTEACRPTVQSKVYAPLLTYHLGMSHDKAGLPLQPPPI